MVLHGNLRAEKFAGQMVGTHRLTKSNERTISGQWSLGRLYTNLKEQIMVWILEKSPKESS